MGGGLFALLLPPPEGLNASQPAGVKLFDFSRLMNSLSQIKYFSSLSADTIRNDIDAIVKF